MRRFAAVVTALALLGSGCAGDTGDGTGDGTGDDTAEFTLDDTRIDVSAGESFTIAVDDNASVGDDWSLSGDPDSAVVTAQGDDYVADSDEDTTGGGGTRYFRFDARAAGTTTVELRNCFRGCHDPEDEHRYEIEIEVG
jgi:predicted secreted protein